MYYIIYTNIYICMYHTYLWQVSRSNEGWKGRGAREIQILGGETLNGARRR